MPRFPDLLFICNRDGIINKVISETVPDELPELTGRAFVDCLSERSVDQGLHFIREMQVFGRVDNRVLQLDLGREVKTFTFSGAFLQDQILLMSAQSNLVAEKALESGPANLVPLTETETEPAGQHPEISTNELLEEMTRLNNELINTKRELIRKNMELERLQQGMQKG